MPTLALINRGRDRWGNLVYRKTARNFGPIIAMPQVTGIVHEIVALGELDPENIVRGIFVQRVVKVSRTATGRSFRQAA